MNISVVNHTSGKVSDEELQCVIRAINRQIREDFAPLWSMSGSLRLEGRSVDVPDAANPSDMRGDAIIYLWDKTDVADASGYHERNASGVPFGFVFTSIAEAIGEHWSISMSHEALELLADPETNLLVLGPHPSGKGDVFHWFEMCDAVQNEHYAIDGVQVSNFVLPLYFTGTRRTDEKGARNDFLGRVHNKRTLKSFGINPGGYIGFYDPDDKRHDTFSLKNDKRAKKRLEIKSSAKQTRRGVRYRDGETRSRLRTPVPADAGPTVAAPAVESIGQLAPAEAPRDPDVGMQRPDND